MVPLDQPSVSFEMINEFIKGNAIEFNPNEQIPSGNTGLIMSKINHPSLRKGGRGMASSGNHSAPNNVIITISHVIALDNAITIRLRAHDLHSFKSNLKPQITSCELLIEPDNREITIDMKNLQRKSFLDININGLKNGVDYHVSVVRIDNEEFIPSAKSKASVRPGCYNPGITQCCDKGICGQNNSCVCDSSYFGTYCDQYESSLSSVTSVSHITSHCPARLFVTNYTYNYNTGEVSYELLSNADFGIKKSYADSSTLNYCSNETSACHLSIELSLQPKTDTSWGASSKFMHYQHTVKDGLLADISSFLENEAIPVEIDGNLVVKEKNVFTSSKNSINVTVAFEKIQITDGDSLLLNNTVVREHQRGEGVILFFNINMKGSPQSVATIVNKVRQSLLDPTSILRKGLISSHIKNSYMKIISHNI